MQADVTKPIVRGRKAARPSGDERIQAILATAEHLLEQRPLTEISVDDLARGAGISRPTFYFYFPSKEAVLLTLVERVIEEADANVEDVVAAIDSGRSAGPAPYWRAVIQAFFSAFGSHRAITVALSAAQGSHSELERRWSSVMQRWVEQTAEAIGSERKRGGAPEGIPASDLATALNLLNEQTMRATFTGQQPAVDETEVVDTLLHIWLNAIYGGVHADSWSGSAHRTGGAPLP